MEELQRGFYPFQRILLWIWTKIFFGAGPCSILINSSLSQVSGSFHAPHHGCPSLDLLFLLCVFLLCNEQFQVSVLDNKTVPGVARWRLLPTLCTIVTVQISWGTAADSPLKCTLGDWRQDILACGGATTVVLISCGDGSVLCCWCSVHGARLISAAKP